MRARPSAAASQLRRRAASGQFAVQADQSGRRKTSGDTRLELRGQVDFRYQQQDLTALVQRIGDQAQVDLGLAAAGHAEQQERLEAGAGGPDRVERRGLLVGQLGRGRRRGQCLTCLPRAWRRRVKSLQPGRQRRKHDFADRCLIVAGTEPGQPKPVCRQHRGRQDFLDRLQLLRRQIAVVRHIDDEADHRTAAERDTHPAADDHPGILRGDVVKTSIKGNVEGDADDAHGRHDDIEGRISLQRSIGAGFS